MSTTTYSQTEASERGLLTQFFNAEGRRIPFWYPEHSEEMIAGAGGVISSVHDLVGGGVLIDDVREGGLCGGCLIGSMGQLTFE